jgi:hypothetical protein
MSLIIAFSSYTVESLKIRGDNAAHETSEKKSEVIKISFNIVTLIMLA